MPAASRFHTVFAPETVRHLAAIERKYQGLIEKTIDKQLGYSPERETRNRKPLERPTPLGATWALGFGPNNRFRVFYEVDSHEQAVRALAVGVKWGNTLWIGGKEIDL